MKIKTLLLVTISYIGLISISHANVCFITDTGECRGYEFSGANSPDDTRPGGGTPTGNDNNDDDWELDNPTRCWLEGYQYVSCPPLMVPHNLCPYNNSIFEKCICDPNLVSCTKPYYGVGEDCDGKYISCELDNSKACQEEGYTQSGECPPLQEINQKCPYDPTYYDKCVCRSDLVSCPPPLIGVGEACDGKYAACQCPPEYQVCNCGPESGAASCNVDGITKYTNCKDCCSDTCPSGEKSATCANNQNHIQVATTECGTPCYSCQDKHSHSYSCPSGYSTSCSYGYSGTTSPICSCGATGSGTCYKCKSAPSCVSGGSSSCTGSTSCQYGYTSSCKDCSGTTRYQCKSCSNTCSSGSTSVSCTSKQNKVSVGKTECGNTCYKCEDKPCSNTCSSGSTSVSCTSKQNKVSVGKTECGNTCYKCEDKPCSNTCSKGSTSVSCAAVRGETKVSVGKTECGNTCYECQCNATCASKGYSSSKPSGKNCSMTIVCGSTCYYNCTTSSGGGGIDTEEDNYFANSKGGQYQR